MATMSTTKQPWLPLSRYQLDEPVDGIPVHSHEELLEEFSPTNRSSRDDTNRSPTRSSRHRNVDVSGQYILEDWRACIYHGEAEEIRSVLRDGPPGLPNLPLAEYDQNLPLHVAASRGKEYAEALLDAGARVDKANSRISSGTALQWAASSGCFETVELLLRRGANVNAHPGWKGTALIAAVRAGSRNMVALLLGYGADPNQLDLYHCASPISATDNIEIVELLLDYGADVDYTPRREDHALVKAAEANCRPLVRLLLQHGADANMNFKNISLLSWAIRAKFLDIAIELVEHGATFQDHDAASLITDALVQGNMELLYGVVKHGVDPMSLDLSIDCPIFYAASVARLDMLDILLGFGADINCLHHEHKSVIAIALQHGDTNAVDWLLRKGAKIPNPGCWENALGETPRTALWKGLALHSAYNGLAEFFTHYENAETSIPLASLEFPWHIPLLLGLQRQRKVPDLPSVTLQDHVVLVRWDMIDHDGENLTRTEALTCGEYVQQRWGALGSRILGDIGLLAERDTGDFVKRCYDVGDNSKVNCSFKVASDKTHVQIAVDYTDSNEPPSLTLLTSILDWIFSALRLPSSQDSKDVLESSHCCRALPTYVEGSHSDGTIGPNSSKVSGIKLVFTLSSKPLRKTRHDCWLNLFESGWVVMVDGTHKHDKAFGKGLELSYDLMAALAGVEYPVIVNGGVVLLGYQTVLVPTQLSSDFAQFHLEVNHSGQINPFTMTYGSRALTIDHLAFQSMRCYVGWCEAAHILLGTPFCSAYEVNYSNSQQRRDGLQLNGITTGFQLLSTAPISAGVTGQASFGLATNRVNFPPTTVYSRMLRDAANAVAMIYNVKSKQSWGVPKLSVMLHMAHAWIKDNTTPKDFDSPKFRDPIPFADPHFEGFAVVAALEEHGDLIVCGSGKDALRLRTLLLGLNTNMLNISAALDSNNNSSRSLCGFEFMDVVTEPGRGSKMKQINIMPEGRNSNWLKMAKVVDLVIICADLGEAIKPVYSQERNNDACNSLPVRLDMLAMHISCISRLTKRFGEDLRATVYMNEVVIAEGRSWRLSGDTFKACSHGASSPETCWDRTTILQAVRRTGTISPTTAPRRIALLGAVVFGSRNGGGIGFL